MGKSIIGEIWVDLFVRLGEAEATKIFELNSPYNLHKGFLA